MTTVYKVDNQIAFYPALDGSPLQGGSAWFGVAGQNPVTAPVAVYSDPAGTQPVAQPISVSNGRTVDGYGNPIGVYVSSAFSVLVQDKLGRTVFFNQSVSPNSLADLASASGSSLVGFVPSGTGAQPRTVQDKERDIVSVKDFGAVGDGSSHPLSGVYATLAAAVLAFPFVTSLAQERDFAATQAAVNYANSIGGADVYAPNGTYIHGTDTLTMKQKVTLRGAGPTASVFKYSGAGHAFYKPERINSSVAVRTAVRDLGITMTNGAATGGCYVDVGGTYVELTNCALTGGKFGAILDQTELATVRLCDIEAQLAGGAGVWLVNGPDNTPTVTFTAGPAAGATTGTLTGAWAGASGTYNLDFTETVGGAREQRMATLTNASASVSWYGGLSAACNAATTAGSSQFTNRILISECQFNNGAVAASHIIDDGGVSHVITSNNFNSGIVAASPPMTRFCGLVGLVFEGNEMEGGQNCISFQSSTFYGSVGAGSTSNANIRGNVFSMSQNNAAIVCGASASPMFLCGNWFGANAASKVTGASLCNTIIALGNFISGTGNLLDTQPTSLIQIDANVGILVTGLLSKSGGIGYTAGAGAATTQGAGSKANGVTVNKSSGEITMDGSALAASTTVVFTVTNTTVAADDVVTVVRKSGGTAGAYQVWCDSVAAGSFVIAVRNSSGGSLSEPPVLQFNVMKGTKA